MAGFIQLCKVKEELQRKRLTGLENKTGLGGHAQTCFWSDTHLWPGLRTRSLEADDTTAVITGEGAPAGVRLGSQDFTSIGSLHPHTGAGMITITVNKKLRLADQVTSQVTPRRERQGPTKGGRAREEEVLGVPTVTVSVFFWIHRPFSLAAWFAVWQQQKQISSAPGH